jgi:hypothetical protein
VEGDATVLKIVTNERAEEGVYMRDELAREGARRMLTSALETLLGEDAVGLSATDIGRLDGGMPGGVPAVSQAHPGWMRVRVRVGEGVRFNVLKLTLDRPSVQYPVQPQLRTHETNYPPANTGPESRHNV